MKLETAVKPRMDSNAHESWSRCAACLSEIRLPYFFGTLGQKASMNFTIARTS
jgi:hypothetical protein